MGFYEFRSNEFGDNNKNKITDFQLVQSKAGKMRNRYKVQYRYISLH
jgi:hypothetical protein